MKNQVIALGITAALLAAGDLNVHAASYSWTGAADSLWTTGNNWSPAGVPGAGDDILFPTAANQTVDLGASLYSIGTLTFNASGAYSLDNGGLTLNGDVTQSGAGTVALNSTTDLGGATRVFNGVGAGVVTFSGPVIGSGFRASLNGGNYVIANAANTVDRFEVKAA